MGFGPSGGAKQGEGCRPVEQLILIRGECQLVRKAKRPCLGAKRGHDVVGCQRRHRGLQRIATRNHLRTRERQAPVTVFSPAGFGALPGPVGQHNHGDALRLDLGKTVADSLNQPATDIDHTEPIEDQRVDMRQDVDKPAGAARRVTGRTRCRHLAPKCLIDADDVIKGNGVRRGHAQAGG